MSVIERKGFVDTTWPMGGWVDGEVRCDGGREGMVTL